MLSYIVFVLCFSTVFCDAEYVTKKLCKDVDTSHCHVHNVVVDPCPQGPSFCLLKRNKSYGLTIDMTPFFSAKKVKLAISADVDNNGDYATIVKRAEDACDILLCPVENEQRRIFDVDLTLDKRASGKFPVKVKLWNEDDESQVCCTTFTVKVK